MNAEIGLAEHAIAVAIAHAGERAMSDLRAQAAAEQERQNRSFAQLQRHHRARFARLRLRHGIRHHAPAAADWAAMDAAHRYVADAMNQVMLDMDRAARALLGGRP